MTSFAGQLFFRDTLQVGQRVADRDPFLEIGLERDCTHSVETVELAGTGKFRHRHQTCQRDQLVTDRRTYLHVVQRAGGALIVTFAFEDDVVLLAAVDIGSDVTAPEQRLQGIADGAHGNAQRGGAVVVDLDAQLWLGFLVVAVHRLEAAAVVTSNARQQPIAPVGQLFVGAAADDELDRLLDPAAKALAHHRRCSDAGQIRQPAADVGKDIPGRSSITPIIERNDGHAVIEVFDIAEAARTANRHLIDVTSVDQCHQAGLDLVVIILHVVKGRAGRPFDQHEKGAAIFLGRIFVGQLLKQPGGECQHQGEQSDHDPAPTQRP